MPERMLAHTSTDALEWVFGRSILAVASHQGEGCIQCQKHTVQLNKLLQ
jgi:hypothetical protein